MGSLTPFVRPEHPARSQLAASLSTGGRPGPPRLGATFQEPVWALRHEALAACAEPRSRVAKQRRVKIAQPRRRRSRPAPVGATSLLRPGFCRRSHSRSAWGGGSGLRQPDGGVPATRRRPAAPCTAPDTARPLLALVAVFFWRAAACSNLTPKAAYFLSDPPRGFFATLH
jgi:hypothetical protein